jgi:hypothetical protein
LNALTLRELALLKQRRGASYNLHGLTLVPNARANKSPKPMQCRYVLSLKVERTRSSHTRRVNDDHNS